MVGSRPSGSRTRAWGLSKTSHSIALGGWNSTAPLITAAPENRVFYGGSPLSMPKKPRNFGSSCHSGW